MMSSKPKLYGVIAAVIMVVSAGAFWNFVYRDVGVNEIKHQVLAPEGGCDFGRPCEYPDEVDFRMIVITYNRPSSLLKTLKSVDTVELDGDRGALEIWIDRNKKGKVDEETLMVARTFNWSRGPTRVHVQEKHAGIYGQWIDTWRPRVDSKELAVILEDDVSVAPFIYRWIKAVHNFYSDNRYFGGSSLTSDEMKLHDGSYRTLRAPKNHTVFMYKCIGTWGFSPTSSMWRDFQDWYHINIVKKDFHPYVPGLLATKWYEGFEKTGTADSMWEMWAICYMHIKKLYTIYNNLPTYEGNTKSCLSINRREIGLHNSVKGREDLCQLMSSWKPEYIRFNKDIMKIGWNGEVLEGY